MSRTGFRLAVSASLGAIALVLAGVFWNWAYAPAIGWDVTAVIFCTWIWVIIWPMSQEDTAAKARSVDPNRATSDVLMLTACVASIGAVGIVVVGAHAAHGAAADLLAALSLISVAVSWLTVHTIFTLRYALLYYEGHEGGVDFNQDMPPSYRDFAYLAITVGMTYQVADTDLHSTSLRAAVLRHALLSYLFGAVILAATINLIAGLSSNAGGF
ncbi:MAG TPA: DUF1345 domain-containing protein [Streptosporangiaceae bacterium]|jgi:uncharacterized membrane protein|nr:DUF1345 domain-containing protein [Streptosporangiaceae bacterium]